MTCTDDGTWTLTLTADDGTNPPVADSLTLVLANADPAVGAGADQPGVLVGETVSLDPATFSDAGANDTHSAQLDWGDGTVVAGTVGTGSVSGSHAYGAPGTYTVTVTVTDDDGGTGSDTFTVTVGALPNDPPVVDAGADTAGTEGGSVALSGSVTDPDDSPTLAVDRPRHRHRRGRELHLRHPGRRGHDRDLHRRRHLDPDPHRGRRDEPAGRRQPHPRPRQRRPGRRRRGRPAGRPSWARP